MERRGLQRTSAGGKKRVVAKPLGDEMMLEEDEKWCKSEYEYSPMMLTSLTLDERPNHKKYLVL